jgi:hypothetical protein
VTVRNGGGTIRTSPSPPYYPLSTQNLMSNKT